MIRKTIALSAFFGALILGTAAAQTPTPPKTVRLLTVGNSFSQNATHYLDDIVKADGNTLIQGRCVIGGSGFAQHMERVEIHERDPKDKAGTYTAGKGLKEYLTSEKWDIITIQQASIRSHDVNNYRPSAKQLYDYIKKYAPQSEVVIHQTWAYRNDDPRFSVKDPKPGEPKTQQEMYDGLNAAYRTIAKELGIRRIPTGDAFILADTDPKWGYKKDTAFDFKTAKPPALPDQTHSLHVGWKWDKGKDGKDSLKIDGHHANMAGEYLGACVFYDFLYNRSPVGNTFRPKGLSDEDAKFLQQAAHTAVEKARAEK